MSKPRLLDLFCGAGGCAMGYARAGFEVVGVDHRPMPRYPFAFVQADALEYLAQHGREFDAIHASPPCQRYSVATCSRGSGAREKHPHLLPIVRSACPSSTPSASRSPKWTSAGWTNPRPAAALLASVKACVESE